MYTIIKAHGKVIPQGPWGFSAMYHLQISFDLAFQVINMPRMIILLKGHRFRGSIQP
jgi:hypothetical protein